MLAERSLSIATVIVSIMLFAPLAIAHGPGDHAHVEVHADNSAAAACQVLVLADALIILEAEDTLGLVSIWSDEPAEIVLAAQAPATTALADCSVVIDQLSISFPGADSSKLARGNRVTGPPPVALATAGSRPGLEWKLEVTGTGSEGVICQVVVIVGSIIMGGGAFGISGGHLPIIDMNAVSEGAGPTADARCRAAIGALTIDGESYGPVEASA